MENGEFARVIYLTLIAVAVGSAVLVQFRGRMGQAAQQAAIWGLIILGLVAGYGLWGDIRRDVTRAASFSEGGVVEIPRGPDGHYHLTLGINGEPVSFIVDTGASEMVLSAADARRVGIDPEGLPYLGRAQTANGVVRTARVTLDRVELGPHVDADVPAQVSEGEMGGSLLGMRYLDRFERLEIRGDRMRLER